MPRVQKGMFIFHSSNLDVFKSISVIVDICDRFVWYVTYVCFSCIVYRYIYIYYTCV